jgi:hypothetical protein
VKKRTLLAWSSGKYSAWALHLLRQNPDIEQAGLRARVTCVDPKVLPAEFVGRDFDAGFLADLPDGVDPCGENGEFHTFVFDGPMFSSPLPIRNGPVLRRNGFVFADVMPG